MGTPLLTLDETIERLEAVTREDLEELTQHLYPPAGLSVAAIGRDEGLFRGALGPSAPSAATPPSRDPRRRFRRRGPDGRDGLRRVEARTISISWAGQTRPSYFIGQALNESSPG